MADTEDLFVQVKQVNIRHAPRVARDNILDTLVLGDAVEVLAAVTEESADGWHWRRLAESEEHWIAEVNRQTGMRLLDTQPPAVTESAAPETLYVLANAVNIRRTPQSTADNILARLQHGDAVVLGTQKIVGADGWQWRPLADKQDAWMAEYHTRTGQRLLGRKSPGKPLAGRVRTEGMHFVVDGQPLRFVGANLREFPFYGRSDVLPFASANIQDDQLRAMQEMGMRVVRMHACHRSVSLGDAIPLVGAALDRVQQHGLLAIVVLNDSLGSFWVPGDERFHRHVLGHLDKIDYFHAGGYKENYLPYARRMVTAYRDHPAILAWELGNEYAIHPQPASVADGEAFLRFVEHVSGEIRGLDPNHLIAIGLVNSGHVAPNDQPGLDRLAFARRLYGLPAIDFLTVHFYEGNGEEENSRPDLTVARELNKPLIVEEWGARGGNRAALTASTIAHWTGHGASGFLQWGLSATPFDVGVGDAEFGMDPYAGGNKDHYQNLKQVYREWADKLQQA